jgi:hypothetical protein
MAHFHVDGTLVVARLGRNLAGGGLYRDVTVREQGGQHRNLGTILALAHMKPAMTPGTRGRFYFYDVAGAKGIYGVRPLGGRAQAYFPHRWHLTTLGMGILNLLTALFWFLMGSFAPFAAAMGILCLVLAASVLRTRIGAMRSYRADDACVPGATELCAAEARA